MSVANETHSYRCAYCNGERKPHDSVDGSYCSQVCSDKHDGQKLLNTIRTDHKYCYNCGHKLKDVASKDEVSDYCDFDEVGSGWTRDEDGNVTLETWSQHNILNSAVIGFQYHTKHSEYGHKERDKHGDTLHYTGIICKECGNTQPNTDFPEDRDARLFEYTSHLIDAVREKQDEHEFDVDTQTVFNVLAETGDMELAFGIARRDA